MRPTLFPFAALVGLEPLKIALQLAAIDPHLSVLVRGDKGTGKSTAARALRDLLADGAPFVNLPLGATEDRLLGGLDLERALRGEPALKPGLVAEAHGGVLYVDEVNLLPDHLADALLDAVASGFHVAEREGFSAVQEASFVLVGSMNPEEGDLRPQLTDRFALAVEVKAPSDPAERRIVLERRLGFDESPAAFAMEWTDAQEALARRIREARSRFASVSCPKEMLERIATLVAEQGVASLRADLAVVRASRALAALEGASEISEAQVETVLPLVLSHRVAPGRTSQPPPSSASPSSEREAEKGNPGADRERVFSPRAIDAPRLVISGAGEGASRSASGLERGPVIGARRAEEPREVDARASVVHSLTRTGSPTLRREDLHEKRRAPRGGKRFLFVVDSSGSHAVGERMRLVKGAVMALLDQSARRADEAAVVTFRGSAATLALAPTREFEDARAALAYVPTGGRTPLAHGLELAAKYVNERTVLVLLTDGRANVPSGSGDPWADALRAAASIRCPALVVDSESGPGASGRVRELANAMGASHLSLESLGEVSMLRLARERSS